MQVERSAGERPSQPGILRAISIRFSWVIGTRLAAPVVPDVRKMAATDFAPRGTVGRGCATGRASTSPMSSNDAVACVTWNNPKLLLGALAQAGILIQP